MRLLKVELTRLFSRRAVIVLMLLGALAVGGVAAGILYDQRPVSDAEIQRAQADADQSNDDPYMVRRLACAWTARGRPSGARAGGSPSPRTSCTGTCSARPSSRTGCSR
jgi:hypothetical protein